MPELPDVELYRETLTRLLAGRPLLGVRLGSPFLLRSVDPPLATVAGKTVRELRRLGKRIVIALDDDLHLVIHLMIAGRFQWKDPGAKLPRRLGQAAFDFDHGTLLLTEAGTKKRASLHVVRGEEGLAPFDRGGLEVLDAGADEFAAALTSENHTVKRALTDPRILSGIGNAYSDEILHRARMSPFKRTADLSAQEVRRLYGAARAVLVEWVERLRAQTGDGFPTKVTAFRPEMAVHGKHGEPCPACGAPVQRIVYAENEANYCAGCQTGGRVLADRALSRLLRDDWPRTLEELEERLPGRSRPTP
ncbi:MAG: DNA-formamidopyrimidine glycosylase family protein [Thermoanaerobaculia bacterium]|nr:DNA-formamidopyrimidine glycosylase family protein [Thermoanaerobaculia bacterium]